jgi:peptidoglycan/LPS O-acetylase OafA/YrhL
MQKPEIPSLTGLRFYAAALVLWAHTVGAFLVPADVPVLRSSSSVGLLGTTLFFVLSGFVIHYNYSSSLSTLTPRALYSFVVARFARLYPLFFCASSLRSRCRASLRYRSVRLGHST